MHMATVEDFTKGIEGRQRLYQPLRSFLPAVKHLMSKALNGRAEPTEDRSKLQGDRV